jgi:formylglycine-generating enzyme required for sulfatase activity
VGTLQRAAFFCELAAALDRPERDVRFIFSLREDYLARLDEARDSLPDVFANSFRLATLDRSNARVAITEPAARVSVMVEAALVDALVGGEGRQSDDQRAGDLVEADGNVPPAVLQIVLDRLYREALPPDHSPDTPPPSNLVLTLAAYYAFRHRFGEGDEAEELQGAEAILASYVNEGLARLPDLKLEDGQAPLGADPKLGEAILKVMVTSQVTKEALTQTRILELLDESNVVRRDDATDQKLVENTRLGLERVRLVRGFERNGIALYELAHDHLAAEVARRIGEAEMGAKLARELLRREVDNWRGARLLIRPQVLGLIDEHRNALKRLNNEELELLFRSALAAGVVVRYWAERAQSKSVNVEAIALAGLGSQDFRVRAAAATQLGLLADETFIKPLAEMLADPYPQVRMAVIRSLEKFNTPVAWQALLSNLVYEVYVPAGEVEIGGERWDNEKPIHQVNVDAFYIGRYPVTNAGYKHYMDDVGRPFEIPPKKADHPVVNVSWYDARDYAAWAGMRLLTEVEWEKAAGWSGIREIGNSGQEAKDKGQWSRFIGGRQGGKERVSTGKKFTYPWGNVFDKKKCNTLEAGVEDTTPIGQYSSQGDSPLGVGDVAGNVWEWTSSLHHSYPYQANDGREDPYASDSRVIKGGAFDSHGWGARCAYRNHDYPNFDSNDRGFRVGAMVLLSLSLDFSES